jgi:hypothetical protein
MPAVQGRLPDRPPPAPWQSAFRVLEQCTGIEKRLQRGRRKIVREC